MSIEKKTIKVSVRDLVEFVMRSGDIDTTKGVSKEIEAMKKGTKLHKKIQKSMARNYMSEVMLKEVTNVRIDDFSFSIAIEGRADGVILPDKSKNCDRSYMEILKDNYVVHQDNRSDVAYNYSFFDSLELDK